MHIVIDNQMQRDAMPGGIKALVVDNDLQRRSIVKELLNNMGFNIAESYTEIKEVSIPVSSSTSQNAVLIAYVENLTDNILTQLVELLSKRPMPVLFLIEEISNTQMTSAMEAGVTAFVSLGVKGNRINHAINTAIANFDVINTLKDKIDSLENRLENRIVIDKAKGLIMKNRGLDEEEAYSYLRSYAMKNGKRIIDVAEMTIATAELLSKTD